MMELYSTPRGNLAAYCNLDRNKEHHFLQLVEQVKSICYVPKGIGLGMEGKMRLLEERRSHWWCWNTKCLRQLYNNGVFIKKK